MSEDLWPIKWPATMKTEDYDQEELLRHSQTAVNILKGLTLNRVGGVRVTARPCGRIRPGTYKEFTSHLPAGARFRHTSNCSCRLGCSCTWTGSVKLLAPVQSITAVFIDGEEVDPDTYWVDGGAWLIRAEGSWPVCSRNFFVEYISGHAVPLDGQYAAGVLAEEFLRSTRNPSKCRLPRGVTELTRQGVSISVEAGLFPDGMTGLPEVDAFIHQWNPHGMKVRPRVYSPDMPKTGTSW